jgi:hypothetical protein
MAVETIFPPQAYTVLMPFDPVNGGRGLALAAGVVASAPIALPANRGQTCLITNDGPVCFWVGFGGATIQATLADLPVLPGTQVTYTLPNDGTCTHLSTVARQSGGLGTINFGLGS